MGSPANPRGRSNHNSQPSSKHRLRLKQWMLDTFGDGTTATCSFEGCDLELTIDTVSMDRYPIMGMDGGTYRKSNIRPACLPHNSLYGSLEWHRRQGHTIHYGREAS